MDIMSAVNRENHSIRSSEARFPDGGAWRVEIPSIENLENLETAINTSKSLGVPIHRVSQGSGVGMLSDPEIVDMVEAAREEKIELCLFARPGANWGIGASRSMPIVGSGSRARTLTQVGEAVRQVLRGCELGVTSFLVADEGVLFTLHHMRSAGQISADVQFKVSVTAAPLNPVTFLLDELLGADTINVPSDIPLSGLQTIRELSSSTIDFYIETPDDAGGFVRYGEIAEIVRIAAPIYLKFGVRNAPNIYPAGNHLKETMLGMTKERVRRAAIGLAEFHRSSNPALVMSALGEREQPAGRRFAPADV